MSRAASLMIMSLSTKIFKEFYLSIPRALTSNSRSSVDKVDKSPLVLNASSINGFVGSLLIEGSLSAALAVDQAIAFLP